jgi:hypothetical protein
VPFRERREVGTVRQVSAPADRRTKAFRMQHVCDPALFRNVPVAATGETSHFVLSKRRRFL